MPPQREQREVDVGFIGDIYWPFVGDDERTRLISHLDEFGDRYGLRCEIRRSRLARTDWVKFLQAIRGTVGAESGTYYLNDRGRLLESARHYNLKVNREARPPLSSRVGDFGRQCPTAIGVFSTLSGITGHVDNSWLT